MANLVSLYVSWEHATVRIFDESYFIEQLVAGEEAYCSPLLVNAVHAVATLNYRAIDPAGASRLSPLFHDETERLWKEEESRGGLLAVPAAVLLDIWWKAHDDPALGQKYLQRGIDIANDLGLFQMSSSSREGHGALSKKDRKGRAMIAWGIFNWQG